MKYKATYILFLELLAGMKYKEDPNLSSLKKFHPALPQSHDIWSSIMKRLMKEKQYSAVAFLSPVGFGNMFQASFCDLDGKCPCQVDLTGCTVDEVCHSFLNICAIQSSSFIVIQF